MQTITDTVQTKQSTEENFLYTFKKDVQKGLSESPKMLSSKYFYDKIGDALFVEIMNLPEYYLTRSEHDIFKNKTQELIEGFGIDPNSYFELIELGAGDGLKTKELLKMLDDQNYTFDYLPIDFSSNALTLLEQNLAVELPNVSVRTQQGDYFEVLASLKESKQPKVILFLGSNIGNMSDAMTAEFVYNLGANLQLGDKLLICVDLIKAKEIVLPAYNDSRGVTANFNLNLLDRINHDLGGDFNRNNFQHLPEYDEDEGIAKSAIVSTIKQKVTIKALAQSFEFEAGEKIHTEISRKYNDVLMAQIISKTDFSIETKILDSKNYFADYILTRK
ncbi:L-histidine N(alpha)-methyltransferase [Flavobacterium ovatum]|uniref:L-histidine N(alpha)-methyltransferase n=1 Tax=Flavobacterium ovatum TaxID=1928857 RepID=UPI00344C9E7C